MGHSYRGLLVLSILVLILFPTIADAGTNIESHNNAKAEITAPDEVYEDDNFLLTVKGMISGTSSWSVYLYRVYENAEWYYDSNHRVVVSSYEILIDNSGYKWGTGFSKTYNLARQAGTYTYTFVFYDLGAVHSYYAVAVDSDVEVKKKFVSPEDIDYYIQSLPDEAFKNGNGNLKNSFHNKLSALAHQIEVEDFESAVGKTPNDLKDKIDKWIVDPEARVVLHEMLNILYEWLLTKL